MVKHLLALFAAAGAPFGAVAALVGTAAFGWSGLLGGLAIGAIFGGLMAGVLGLLSVERQRSLGLTLDAPLGPRQQRRVEVPAGLSSTQVASACRQALLAVDLEPVASRLTPGDFIARVAKANFWSVGTEVQLSPSPTSVEVSARPIMATVMTDYGEARVLIDQVRVSLLDKLNDSRE